MNSPAICSSPTYKNLKSKQIQSPKELKEKLRKDYKNKVQKSRNMLLNSLRGSVEEMDIRNTLTNIYNDIINESSNESLKNGFILDDEETKILEEIKRELIQEELDWCLEEYEKNQIEDIDWSVLVQHNENVICPICQKNNFSLSSGILSCKMCNITIKTNKSLKDIKNIIFNILDNHNIVCSNTIQFSAVSELNDTHIYFICESCMDMKLII